MRVAATSLAGGAAVRPLVAEGGEIASAGGTARGWGAGGMGAGARAAWGWGSEGRVEAGWAGAGWEMAALAMERVARGWEAWGSAAANNERSAMQSDVAGCQACNALLAVVGAAGNPQVYTTPRTFGDGGVGVGGFGRGGVGEGGLGNGGNGLGGAGLGGLGDGGRGEGGMGLGGVGDGGRGEGGDVATAAATHAKIFAPVKVNDEAQLLEQQSLP